MAALVIASKIFIAVMALFLTYVGSLWAFNPDPQMNKLAVSVDSIPGRSALRSIMGTGLLTMAMFCGAYVLDPQTWRVPLLTFCVVLAVLRALSLLRDGYHPRMALYLVLEILAVGAAAVGG